MKLKTDQEKFWAGEFGDFYIDRNSAEKHIENNKILFQKILKKTNSIHSVIEFGANIGNNLAALNKVMPNLELTGIEINKKASERLIDVIGENNVINDSVLNYVASRKFDLVLTKGFLIHVDPKNLNEVYSKIYDSAKKYIVISEYFNPSPVEVVYRGHKDKLFKRDFAGDLLDKYKDLSLIDYGFAYKRDPDYPQDNLNWFLLKLSDEP